MSPHKEDQEPHFNNPPHQLPSLYERAILLLCDTCGYWEVVEDVWEGQGWRSERTIPYTCDVCYGEPKGTVHSVEDDQPLEEKREA